MPKTAPCTIAVLQDGQPLAGVWVSLRNEEVSGALTINGTTNASGVALIKTAWGNYEVKGAPVGVSKVTVVKFFDIPGTVTEAETEHWTQAQVERYEHEQKALADKLRIIPVVLSSPSLTPLTVTVEPRIGGTLTVDINEYKD